MNNAELLRKKPLLALIGFAAALAATTLNAQTLYMNPAATGNLTSNAVWSTTLGGTYDQSWSDGNNMYFDPTGAITAYTISANMTTAGTITVGSTSNTSQTIRLNSSGNTVSFTSVTFLDTVATDTLGYYGPTLPGGSFSVNGRGVFQFSGTPTSTFVGTITANSAAGSGNNTQINFSNNSYSGTGTSISLNGQNNSNAQLAFTGGTTLTIGSLTSNAYAQVNPSGGSGLTTLIVDQATNTTYASGAEGNAFGFIASRTGLVQKQGVGNLTFSGKNAFISQYTAFEVAGGMLIVANTNNTTTALDYNTITVSAGGTLASDATKRSLVGNSQTVNATTGDITAGANTNGFIAATSGATSVIDPTGTFALTQLEAQSGLTMKIDSAADRLSLFTLTGTTAAGGFRIDLTGFTGIADSTTYTVLSWLSGSGVELADFAGVLGGGKTMNSAFGTGGFQTVTADGVTSLQLQVVPEPATWAMVAGAGAILMLARRRRA